MVIRRTMMAILIGGAAAASPAVGQSLPKVGLVLDLDASVGLQLEDENRVAAWKNQAEGATARVFVKRDKGRKIAGSGRPTLRKHVPAIGGRPALVFRQQELVCQDEDAFDSLTTPATRG